MRVLLVSLQSNTDAIGLKYLHAFVSARGVDSTLLFLPQLTRSRLPAVQRFLRRHRPDVLGISLMSTFLPAARALSAAVRRTLPRATLVWGGIHPTCDPEGSLEHADYVFVGEAERAFLRFIRALTEGRPVDQVPGLAWRVPGGVQQNPVAPLEQDLDALPYPEHHPPGSFVLHRGGVVPLTRARFRHHARFSGRVYSLTSIRGCPYACSYCCNSLKRRLYGQARPRRRSVDGVMDELRRAVEKNPRLLLVKSVDECFLSHDLAWLSEFADRYQREIGLKFLCHTVPAQATDEKLALLRQMGLAWILMGLQSGSERVNREVYNRRMPPEQFVAAAHRIRRHRVAGYYDVILDNPYESDEEQVETVELLSHLPRPHLLQLYSLTFLPGTDLYRRAVSQGLELPDAARKNYHQVRPTPLNRLTRLAPLLPGPLVRFLAARHAAPVWRGLINLIHGPSVALLEPLVWGRMMLMSLDNDLPSVARMMAAFAHTGVGKVLFRRPV